MVSQNSSEKEFRKAVTSPSHCALVSTMEGVKLAEKDRVCASLVASLSIYALYLSCGFKPVGWVGEGDGNPLRDLPSGQILFWAVESTS
jgi:hypothetical protein